MSIIGQYILPNLDEVRRQTHKKEQNGQNEPQPLNWYRAKQNNIAEIRLIFQFKGDG
ncbi:MAG: hypothetical protein ACI351_07795 [Candidatus Avelusimicrobium sp.]|uniref:hypothetical protein n=1 Tax=Candidatus Avelusimicrobium sp. TaxID=3048833 RepID=UPI003F0683B0